MLMYFLLSVVAVRLHFFGITNSGRATVPVDARRKTSTRPTAGVVSALVTDKLVSSPSSCRCAASPAAVSSRFIYFYFYQLAHLMPFSEETSLMRHDYGHNTSPVL